MDCEGEQRRRDEEAKNGEACGSEEVKGGNV